MATRVSPPVLGGVEAVSADGVVLFVHYHLEINPLPDTLSTTSSTRKRPGTSLKHQRCEPNLARDEGSAKPLVSSDRSDLPQRGEVRRGFTTPRCGSRSCFVVLQGLRKAFAPG